MKLKMRKPMLIIVILVVLFGLYNLAWFALVNIKYDGYKEGMEESRKNLSYISNAEDGYIYYVKKPDYLSFIGNINVKFEDNQNFCLIIWPHFFSKGCEYGIRIPTEEDTYSIMIDRSGNALETEYSELIKQHHDDILLLFGKAKERYGDI